MTNTGIRYGAVLPGGRAPAAAEAARQPEEYRALAELLRRWRLGALTISDPGYESRRVAVREAARAGQHGTPIEEVVPDWADRLRRR